MYYPLSLGVIFSCSEKQEDLKPSNYPVDDVFLMKKSDYIIWDYERRLIPKSIFFHLNKSDLRKESIHILDSLYLYLQKNEDKYICLSGHADTTGMDERNTVLALDRAKRVSDYLQMKGISSERIRIQAHSDTLPIPNLPSDKLYLNRRVEFDLPMFDE